MVLASTADALANNRQDSCGVTCKPKQLEENVYEFEFIPSVSYARPQRWIFLIRSAQMGGQTTLDSLLLG